MRASRGLGGRTGDKKQTNKQTKQKVNKRTYKPLGKRPQIKVSGELQFSSKEKKERDLRIIYLAFI